MADFKTWLIEFFLKPAAPYILAAVCGAGLLLVVLSIVDRDDIRRLLKDYFKPHPAQDSTTVPSEFAKTLLRDRDNALRGERACRSSLDQIKAAAADEKFACAEARSQKDSLRERLDALQKERDSLADRNHELEIERDTLTARIKDLEKTVADSRVTGDVSAKPEHIRITNNNAESTKVTITRTDTSRVYVIESGQTLEADCEGGCKVYLGENPYAAFESTGNDSIFIENGSVSYLPNDDSPSK